MVRLMPVVPLIFGFGMRLFLRRLCMLSARRVAREPPRIARIHGKQRDEALDLRAVARGTRRWGIRNADDGFELMLAASTFVFVNRHTESIR
jgi:hypothetical protein